MTAVNTNRSLGELFEALSQDASLLVRQEVALAKAELSEKAAQLGKNAVLVAVGGAIGYVALFFVLAAIAIGLSAFIQLWLAVLIVGLVVMTISIGLILTGLSALKRTSLMPEKTIATLKEDKEWLQQQVQQIK